MKKYLVTGGTGFIGSALVKRLVKEGNSVRVLDNNIRGSIEKLGDVYKDIEFIEGDIRNADIVKKACSGIDSVAHLAYINGTEYFYKMPELVLDVGVRGMLNVIDACIENNIKELILASSSEVYQSTERIPTDESVPLIIPDPLNPRYSYGAGKMISEMLAINYGRKHFDRVLIFRPFNVYGPNMGWEHVIPQFALRMNEISLKTDADTVDFPIQGGGLETRAFIYIDDFIDGLMHVIIKGKHLQTYHIGTMNEVAIKDVACEVGNYFKKEVHIIGGATTQGSVSRRCPDNSKVCALGFCPKISLKDGISATTAWYQAHAQEVQKI
ncbi:MAG: nucleoside-diphosphate-sugar epimerase [Alteromonas naphthalenivorans]|jgi:nucleoside-diphosphate-sugar epimerase